MWGPVLMKISVACHGHTVASWPQGLRGLCRASAQARVAVLHGRARLRRPWMCYPATAASLSKLPVTPACHRPWRSGTRPPEAELACAHRALGKTLFWLPVIQLDKRRMQFPIIVRTFFRAVIVMVTVFALRVRGKRSPTRGAGDPGSNLALGKPQQSRDRPIDKTTKPSLPDTNLRNPARA